MLSIILDLLKLLRYENNSNSPYDRSWYDSNNIHVVMDGVECGEEAKNITDCSTRLMSNNCDHYDDIWLQCNTGEKDRVLNGLLRI